MKPFGANYKKVLSASQVYRDGVILETLKKYRDDGIVSGDLDKMRKFVDFLDDTFGIPYGDKEYAEELEIIKENVSNCIKEIKRNKDGKTPDTRRIEYDETRDRLRAVIKLVSRLKLFGAVSEHTEIPASIQGITDKVSDTQ